MFRKMLFSTFSVFLMATFILAKDAPDFKFKSLQGKEISLSDFKGKIVLLNFWATWCGPCLHEMPNLEKINQKYSDKGVQVIGLTISSRFKDIPVKIKATGVTYPVLLEADNAIADYGSFNSIPQTFIIDQNGKIVKQLSGTQTYEQFETEIKKLL